MLAVQHVVDFDSSLILLLPQALLKVLSQTIAC